MSGMPLPDMETALSQSALPFVANDELATEDRFIRAGSCASEGNCYSPKVEVASTSEKDAEAFWARLEQEALEDEKALTSNDASCSDGQLPEIPYEQRFDSLLRVINNRPSHREILLRILSFCLEEKEFGIVEDEIQTYPEYEYAAQNPYRLIKYLIDGEGLEMLEIGFDGVPLSAEQKEGLTEDEIDDLIDCFHLKTTELGGDVVRELAPAKRLKNIFSLFPDRGRLYLQIMEHCKQPRKYREIEALFKGADLSSIVSVNSEAGIAMKPTVFVDNLEKAGAIAWNDGWIITKEGEAYLKAITGSSVA